MTARCNDLTVEFETFRKLLPTLSGDEGKFALIAGSKLLGKYETYADALDAGYKERVLKPFLVKKISSVEIISYFSRDFGANCHIFPAQ